MAKKQDPVKKFNTQLMKIRNKLVDKRNLEDLAEKAVKMIRDRTRLGLGLYKEGSTKPKKLAPLSPKYKKWRKKNRPSGPTTPAKSNLTYTGDMLDDIDFKITGNKKEGYSIKIGIWEENSKDKALWNAEMGRHFMGLTYPQVKELKRWISKKMLKMLK